MRQNSFSDLFTTLVVLSAIGLVSIVLGLGLGLAWLINHVRFQ